jgi:methionyl-tRNA formyltransferase
VQIERRMRAFDPFPGCTSSIAGESIKLWRCEINSELSPFDDDNALNTLNTCGEIMHISPQGITVATGHGAVRLTQLQKAGGKRLAAADFLRGFPLQVGMRFA